MSRDVRELLEEAAPAPTRPLDAEQLVDRALRQRRIGLAAAAAVVVLVATGAVGLAIGLLPDDRGLHIDPGGIDAQPPAASPYLGGTDDLLLPAGEPGQVSVIAATYYEEPAPEVDWGARPAAAIVVRNLTDQPVTAVEVSGSWYGPDGEEISRVTSTGFHHPERIEPGAVALLSGMFLAVPDAESPQEELDQLRSGTEFDLEVHNYQPASPDLEELLETAAAEDRPFVAFSLTVVEAEPTDDGQIRLRVRNDEPVAVDMQILTYLVCFEDSEPVGTVETVHRAGLGQGLSQGGELDLMIDISDFSCPQLLVGAIGQHSVSQPDDS